MATIKSFTDISQSRKLAEILPIESADGGLYRTNNPLATTTKYWLYTKYTEKAALPAWSLAALLDLLPQGYSLGNRKSNGKYYICMTCVKHDVIEYDEPIDACVEMIIKLHKLNLL